MFKIINNNQNSIKLDALTHPCEASRKQAAASPSVADAIHEVRMKVRIPMKTASDSDGKRPPIPIQSGHFFQRSELAGVIVAVG
jgi:hypothetical protein